MALGKDSRRRKSHSTVPGLFSPGVAVLAELLRCFDELLSKRSARLTAQPASQPRALDPKAAGAQSFVA